jgi:hypothetical protein
MLTRATAPDWSGIWSRPVEHVGFFDSTQDKSQPPTAKLTPEYQAKVDEKRAKIAQGLEYDPLGEPEQRRRRDAGRRAQTFRTSRSRTRTTRAERATRIEATRAVTSDSGVAAVAAVRRRHQAVARNTIIGAHLERAGCFMQTYRVW